MTNHSGNGQGIDTTVPLSPASPPHVADLPDASPWHRSPAWAIALSLLIHALVLCIPRHAPESSQPATRLSASLAPPPTKPAVKPDNTPTPPSKPVSKTKPRRQVLAVEKSKSSQSIPEKRQWSVAEKEDMNRFLDDLAAQPRPAPTLAQRSLAMAHEYGREQARHDEGAEDMVERLPNSPPVDPFSLEMYLDAVVKKLNRSAAYVRNERRTKGFRSALVRVQLNRDGSLRRFEILNAADQQDEIAHVKQIVEQAVPFAAFPADLLRSARSLGMLICIRPNGSDGGFGFSRDSSGRSC